MIFLLKEFAKFFVFSKKKRIGFILSVLPTPYYGVIMASARLRAYDVILNFAGSQDYFVELYKPWKRYDVVIFQKRFYGKAFGLAEKLQKKGTKIVLDINVNYYDKSALKEKEFYLNDEIMKFTEISDAIITSTEYLRDYIQKLFPEKKIDFIPENSQDQLFSIRKGTEKNREKLKLLYVGYAIKAKEVLRIENILKELRKKYDFSLLFICEKNPLVSIEGIESEFKTYRHRKIHNLVAEGDIFISPRNPDPYNIGHSFSKIGLPMSVGLPVLAGPIPSYKGSPAILCSNEAEWRNNLEKVLGDANYRKELSEKGVAYCQKNFSSKVIKEKYERLFLTLLK